MNYTCFYCSHEIEEESLHLVSFYGTDHEYEKHLCDECYSEWLEGIKE